MRRLLFLILVCVFAPPAWAGLEFWQTTLASTEPDAPQIPSPGAPWHPAFWTCAAFSSSNVNAKDVTRLAKICNEGGDLRDALTPETYNFLRFYKRFDIFPGEKIPPHTLIVADFENQEDTDLPLVLCGGLKRQRAKFAQYPSLGALGNDGWINFTWTSQMREIDFYLGARLNQRNGRFAALCGDYALFELYLVSDPAVQEQQYRAWALGLASMRARMPKVKILALVRGSYPDKAAVYSDDVRHRLARFVILCFDGDKGKEATGGVWAWGDRKAALPVMSDLVTLAAEPLHLFAGEEGWVR